MSTRAFEVLSNPTTAKSAINRLDLVQYTQIAFAGAMMSSPHYAISDAADLRVLLVEFEDRFSLLLQADLHYSFREDLGSNYLLLAALSYEEFARPITKATLIADGKLVKHSNMFERTTFLYFDIVRVEQGSGDSLSGDQPWKAKPIATLAFRSLTCV